MHWKCILTWRTLAVYLIYGAGDGSKERGDLARKQIIVFYSGITVWKELPKKLKEHTHCLKLQIDVYFKPFCLLMFFHFSHVNV